MFEGILGEISRENQGARWGKSRENPGGSAGGKLI